MTQAYKGRTQPHCASQPYKVAALFCTKLLCLATSALCKHGTIAKACACYPTGLHKSSCC